MRVSIVIAVTAGLLGCTQQDGQQAAASSPAQQAQSTPVRPMPAPPSERAPVCARPQEKQAVAVSALISQLQVTSILCHTEDKYNELIPRLRPTLTANLKVLDGFFARAYGSRAIKVHDDYITELANLQSQLGLKSGDQFCALNGGMMDEVMTLQTPQQLIDYATSKPIQQALAVADCTAAR
jgi:hypothetical protein